jgi:hypothetical protein
MKFYADGHMDSGFDEGIEMVWPACWRRPFGLPHRNRAASAKLNTPHQISDLTASRLSFFLWSTGPTISHTPRARAGS